MRAETLLVLGLGVAIGAGFTIFLYKYRKSAHQSAHQMSSVILEWEIVEDERGNLKKIIERVKSQ